MSNPLRNPESHDWNDLEFREQVLGRKPCCIDDFGGSHYHCGRCGKTSSMMGHFRGVHWESDGTTKKVRNHYCCPGNCELDEDS